MTRKGKQSPLIPVDPELNRTLRNVRRLLQGTPEFSIVYSDSDPEEIFATNEEDNMGDNNPPPPLLRDYDHPNAFTLRSGIRLPTTNANNFELSPQLIRMIQSDQFGGSSHECPFAHLDNFLELCTTIKQNNITEEFIRMHMF